MGGATTSPYSETASGSPLHRAATCRTISGVTNGMSASSTIAALASGGTAWIPARSEVFIPLA